MVSFDRTLQNKKCKTGLAENRVLRAAPHFDYWDSDKINLNT